LGWFGKTATHDVMQVANAPYQSSHKFEDMFVCDPKAKNHGYKSWDGKSPLPLPLTSVPSHKLDC
jgi:phosphatidylserine decarboxylase